MGPSRPERMTCGSPTTPLEAAPGWRSKSKWCDTNDRDALGDGNPMTSLHRGGADYREIGGGEGYRERENTMKPSRLGIRTAANVVAFIVSPAAMMPFT